MTYCPVAQLWGQTWTSANPQYFGGAKLASEYYVIIMKCQMSVDANHYDLQNVKCQRLLPSCKIPSRPP